MGVERRERKTDDYAGWSMQRRYTPKVLHSTAVNHKGKSGDRQSRKIFVSGANWFDGWLTDF
jgi:hypothetical protein